MFSELIKLDQLIAQMPGHVYWLDRNNVYQGCNNIQAKSFKLASRHEVIGKTNRDLQEPKIAEICDKNNIEVMNIKIAKIFEEPIILKDGTLGIVLSHKAPILDVNAEVVGILGLSTDVTKKNQHQDQLQRERDQALITLENIITNLPGHIYWLDRDNIYLGCNDKQAKVFGLRSPKEIIGKTNYNFIKDKKEAEIVNNINMNVMEADTPLLVEEKVLLQGQEQIYLSQKVPIKDHNNEIIGIVGISFDITERKKIESDLIEAKKQAEAANNAKTEFLKNIRHDIRTPIVGIIGCAELIKGMKELSKISEYSDVLIKSSNALLNFLNDILNSIEATSGDVPILKKKFNLESILTEVIKINQAVAYDKQLDLKLEYDYSIPKYLIGDSKRLYRITLELVTNALKYTKQGSVTITVQLAKNDGNDVVVKILVKDTGIGIPLNKQEDIFVKFVRLSPSFQGIYSGSGLGLTVAKGFLSDLGGEIYVTSEMNKGSIFTCIIPFKKALLTEEFGADLDVELCYPSIVKLPEFSNEPANIEASFGVPIGHILLVEDHGITARITKQMILDLNYKVDIAINGEMAIDLMRNKIYDIVFMDLGLPDMTGYEVVEKIRVGDKNKSVPIIGLTAHASVEDKQRCLIAGMNAVFIKPLMKENMENICDVFMPKNTKSKDDRHLLKNINKEDLFVLTGDVVDLKLGMQLSNGNEELANNFLSILIDSFPEELAILDSSYKTKDLETMKSIVHKLRGGLSYCGTPRLKEACVRLDNYLMSDNEDLLEKLYYQFLMEFNKVEQEVRNLQLIKKG